MRLDLDFNGHVGNRNYISLALLTIPDEMLRRQRLTQMIIHWLRESCLGDTLRSQLCLTEDGRYLHIVTNTTGDIVCEMLTCWEEATETSDISLLIKRV